MSNDLLEVSDQNEREASRRAKRGKGKEGDGEREKE